MSKIRDAAKRFWNGEHRCVQHGCTNSAPHAIETMGGYVYACRTHKLVAGGTRPKNILAAAERAKKLKLEAEARRQGREEEGTNN